MRKCLRFALPRALQTIPVDEVTLSHPGRTAGPPIHWNFQLLGISSFILPSPNLSEYSHLVFEQSLLQLSAQCLAKLVLRKWEGELGWWGPAIGRG